MLSRRTSPRLSGNRDARVGRQVNRTSSTRLIESLEGRVLLHSGDRDPSFGLGGVAPLRDNEFAEHAVQDIVVANGRTYVGGTAYNTYDSASATFPDGQVLLSVYDSAGNPVNSFSGDGVETEPLAVTGGVIDMLVQPDGKVVVLAGQLNDPDSSPRVLARFNANGTLDTAFGQKTITLWNADNIARTPAGDLVVAGNAPGTRTGQDPTSGNVTVVRYGSNGAFKSQRAININGVAVDLAAQSDNKVLIFAARTYEDVNEAADGLLVRVKSDFSGLDTSFSGDGIVQVDDLPSDGANSLGKHLGKFALDGQGRIVVAATQSYSDTVIRRVLSNGSIDSSFATTHAPVQAYDFAISPNNGKILITGTSGVDLGSLQRYNANGGVDTSFGDGGSLYTSGIPYDEAYFGGIIAPTADGRIMTGYGDVVRLTGDNATPVGTVTLGADGVLHVTGTNGNDDIGFSAYGGVVTINGRTPQRNGELPYGAPAPTRIEISTLGGNDLVDNSSEVWGESESDPANPPRVIHGGTGNDTLYGGGGKDQLIGEDGNDKLYAGGGDDTIIDGPGTDLSDGGLGADTVDYSFRSGPVYVDLQGDADDGPAGEKDTIANSIEQIIGSKGNDTLVGDSRPNYIRGGGGDDTIRGGGGNDTLIGDAGRDKLYGEDGDDFLDARDGITDLVLDGGGGTDTAKKDDSDPRVSIEVLYTGP